ncbi:MAG: tripartite tricarboxylate transporter substrate binding protein [Burkholderiaceae bacterium]|nr:tripartite tricarboxylate transporter substrate binding protein [Burkholderiaceae bacterium]
MRAFTRAVLAILGLLLIGVLPAAAQGWPARPVRIVVPYQPGQGTDVLARFLAERLGKEFGQAFVVDNRAGAGGNIGAAEAARAAPDGYSIVMGTNGTHVLNAFLYAQMPFDAEKQFAPIGLVSIFPLVLIANPASPHQSLGDVLAAAKAKPDSIDVALPSTTARLVLELLKQDSGTMLRAIPYKGSATSMTDLIGGQVGLAIDTVSAAKSFIASGKVRVLGVTSRSESALLPGVRTVAAQGLPGFQVVAWNALYAPHGTPTDVIQRLNAAVAKILAEPEVRLRMLELGHEPAGGSPAELAAFAQSERQKWGPLAQRAGIKAE